MKKILLSLFASTMMLTAYAQFPGGGGGFPGGGFPGGGMPMGGGMPGGFGFGGQQISAEDMHYSEKFTDLNYADDGQAYHNLDVYLPEKKADKYPVVIHIYGSAWFSNSSKGAADLGTIVTALLKAGYAVVCPNHRSSMDAGWPAQSHDIKAVIRWIRGNAEQYKFDTNFIATSGFSSGGHLSTFMASTSGTKTAKVGNGEMDIEGSLGKYTDQNSQTQACVDWSGPIAFPITGDGSGTPEEGLLKLKENLLFGSREAAFASLSAITFVDPKDPPTIIFHGTEDNVVPIASGEKYAAALKEKGVLSEYYPVQGGGHGFNMYTEENLQRMVTFLDKARANAATAQAEQPASKPAKKATKKAKK